MKQYILIIALALMACTFSSCHNEVDEYMADVTIAISSEEATEIDRVQATATLTNLNTKQTITSTNFIGNRLTETVLRGAYKISIDGVIRYTDKKNEVRVRSFRSTTDFISVGESNSKPIEMQTIFTD